MIHFMKRLSSVLFFFILLVGCARANNQPNHIAEDTAVSSSTPTVSPRATATPSPIVNAASRECTFPIPEDRQFPLPPWPYTNFCKHSVPYEEIRWGGRQRDSIPAIDSPMFETIPEAELWLTDREPVLVLQLEDDVRAYPISILIWHEIVNDVVAEQPIVITYCPLCNSGLAFERRLDGQLLDFGVSGNLRFADLIMYDRQTESWWQQFSGEGIVGELTGKRLKQVPVSLVSFADFKTQFPNGRILSIFTGYDRRYSENPYINYDSRLQHHPTFFNGELDERLVSKMRVMTIRMGEIAVAYPYDLLTENGVIHDQIEGQDLVVFWQSGTNTPLYQQYIPEARDAGSAAIFSPEVNEELLTFTSTEAGFVDAETGSVWNIFGTAVSGPLQGSQLTNLHGHESFWFAWAAFNPDTLVYGQ